MAWACGQGCCPGCPGARELELTREELNLLTLLGQLAFLPAARRWDSEIPVCLEEGMNGTEASSAAILGLERKGLIDLDWHTALAGFDYAAYDPWPCHGSMALTARGQQVLEVVEIVGVQE